MAAIPRGVVDRQFAPLFAVEMAAQLGGTCEFTALDGDELFPASFPGSPWCNCEVGL